jgi:nicotinate dehydrogenase subunit B
MSMDELRRRHFLVLTGSGLFIFFHVDVAAQERGRPSRLPYPTDLNAYLKIGEDGRVTGLVGKVELGQGAMTSLTQVLAEELDVPLDSVEMVMGDTDLCPWSSGERAPKPGRCSSPWLPSG